MKKLIIVGLLVTLGFVATAQNCDSIVLPYFGGDVVKMEQYRSIAPEKFHYRCVYSFSAFEESDTVPAGADVIPISSVQSRLTNEYLTNDFVVDLLTLSYYAYNFNSFQAAYSDGNKVLCFFTPSSTHPYLVLHSLNAMLSAANEWWENHEDLNQEE